MEALSKVGTILPSAEQSRAGFLELCANCSQYLEMGQLSPFYLRAEQKGFLWVARTVFWNHFLNSGMPISYQIKNLLSCFVFGVGGGEKEQWSRPLSLLLSGHQHWKRTALSSSFSQGMSLMILDGLSFSLRPLRLCSIQHYQLIRTDPKDELGLLSWFPSLSRTDPIGGGLSSKVKVLRTGCEQNFDKNKSKEYSTDMFIERGIWGPQADNPIPEAQ